jgi:dihydroxyacetone kinase-like predicted kinase
VRVAVIPTTAQVQGIAALAVHDPGRSFDDDVVQMSAAAGQTRHGAVTIALGQAMTTAGPCEPGDVLGVVDGDFALVGKDVASIGAQVVDRLPGGSGELVTIVTGADLADGVAGQIERRVIAGRPDIDVQVYDGGQSRYVLLLAVE